MLKHTDILNKLTVEQKIALAASLKSLTEPQYAAAGIPLLHYSGTHRANAAAGYPLPPFSAMANSWNERLISEAASLIAESAAADGVNFMFTPDLRLKSDPYQRGLSEDPYLASLYAEAIAAAFKAGGVLPCLSGCALNDTDAEFLDKEVNDRSLHEYFLRPFSSYQNSKNGVVSTSYTSPEGNYSDVNTVKINSWLHKNGEGFVVCTGADKRAYAAALRGGNLLWSGDAAVIREAYNNYARMQEAVCRGECGEGELEDAVNSGRAISEAALDDAADRAIDFAFFCQAAQQSAGGGEAVESTPLRAAEESIVLLKNEGGFLPLQKGEKVAVIGRIPIPGGGSSEAAFAQELTSDARFSIVGTAAGYDMAGDRSDDLLQQACLCADGADTVILFLGSDGHREEEMVVNRKVKLPANQLALVSAIAGRGKKIMAVLSGELNTDMSFDKYVSAVLVAPLGGKCCMRALLSVISGNVCPSGRLASTCYDDPDGLFERARAEKDAGRTKVGPFIGYLGYTTADIRVRYPFGFGLSYTNFEYSALAISGMSVSFTVKNVGGCDGCEVAQVYAGKKDSAVPNAARRLVAFKKIKLRAGESKNITLNADVSVLSVFYDGKNVTEGGVYDIMGGTSSQDIRLAGNMRLQGKTLKPSGERLSDYLQTYSNVLSRGYVFGSVKSVGSEGKKLIYGGITLTFVFMAVALALLVFSAVGFMSVWQPGGAMVAFIIMLCLAAAGACLWILGKKKRRAAELNAKVISEENMQDKKIHSAKPYERLFEELFDEEEDEVQEAETSSESSGDMEEFRNFNPSLTLPLACSQLVSFAAERGIALGERSAVKIFSAFCASRLIILNSKTIPLAQKLVGILGEFFGSAAYVDEYSGYRSAEDMMFKSSADGFKEKSAIACAVFDSPASTRTIHIAALTGVVPGDISAFFMPFTRYINFPADGSTITLSGSGNAENTFRISPNLWFVFVCAEGADISKTDPYIASVAAYLDIDLSVTAEREYKTEKDPFGYYQLRGSERTARENYALDEERGWKRVDKLESYVKKHVAYSSDNKSWTRMEKYASVYLACGGEQQDALDCTVASKMMLPVLTSPVKNGEGYDLLSAIDNAFGDDGAPECKRVANDAGYAANN